MMHEETKLLRAAVEASIAYALASREEGADGHRQSAHQERDAAEVAWKMYDAHRPLGIAGL